MDNLKVRHLWGLNLKSKYRHHVDRVTWPDILSSYGDHMAIGQYRYQKLSFHQHRLSYMKTGTNRPSIIM